MRHQGGWQHWLIMTAAVTPKGERRRYALVSAAADLLREGGFEAVRHRAVARRAGLPLASTTYYFSSLDNLVENAVEHIGAMEAAQLRARVEALSRRRETGAVATTLKVGDLEMNLINRTVHRAGQEIDLQPREFQLLEFMMRHAGQSVTRTMLLEKVWEYHFDPQTNVIDVHISRLRSKIDKGFDRAMLQTVRGAGYRLDP